jgi:hypothetical protein
MMCRLLAARDRRRRNDLYGRRQIFDTVIRHHPLGFALTGPVGCLVIAVVGPALVARLMPPPSLALGFGPGSFATRRRAIAPVLVAASTDVDQLPAIGALADQQSERVVHPSVPASVENWTGRTE